MTAVSLRGVGKVYGDKSTFAALHDVDLDIESSEFLVITSTFARAPILAVLLALGLLLALGALLLRLSSIAFGPVRGPVQPAHASYLPIFAHLALVLVAGVYLPAPLVAWFQHVAVLLG